MREMAWRRDTSIWFELLLMHRLLVHCCRGIVGPEYIARPGGNGESLLKPRIDFVLLNATV